MDLPQIGSHCALPSCNDLDFLPILCKCNKYFCRHHISPELHACPELSVQDAASRRSDSPLQKLQRCAVQECENPSLDAYNATSNGTCVLCHKSFCAHHRYPESHSCSPPEVPLASSKIEAARALLAKNFPPSSSSSQKSAPSRRAKIPTDPVKLAQYRKVEILKLRHRATPGDPKDKATSVPVEQRIHIRVAVDEKIEKAFWFRKTMVTGRVLDFLMEQLKIKSSPMQLNKVPESDTDEPVPLRNDQLLAGQVEDGCKLTICPQ